jgi:hypothetical protein
MVGYPFKVSNGPKKDTMVSYSTGNPMGAYSSWASFSLTIHFVMFALCQELNLEWKTAQYCVLGDDVLIGHRALGEAFRRCLTELGVEVSELKTYISDDMFEFCKR